ncbi:DUF4331 family protein [Streptomyces sp. TBY4]|uniref:DUF4331 family protein n=1 Tax=Streptomyces sp. TBY4 TaxID=2962030 RepID=UPI0020B7CE08|nr:DUF4331 family protein [Streptomyces sp. TBY4]MCP3757041.1 DUF4331 domain-containing protein [Streptomyces sp. TBY4]
MNVHPIAPAEGAAFHPDAVYRINVDTDGDQQADVAFSLVFSPPRDGSQTATMYRATGTQARAHEAVGYEIFTDAPVGSGPEPAVVEAGPYRFSAGPRSDPFFADLDGIVKEFQWTGVDWGADKNVLGIVLEMPNAELAADPTIGVWARVSLHQDGQLKSVDRGAHPSLTAYFNAEDAKDTYNAGEPAKDWDTYREPWTAALQHFGNYEPRAAEQALRTVLPDILRYDRARPAAYPNGRTLTDDVTSARLSMLSNGKITTDHIAAHTDLLPAFPYLGTPHPLPAGG